MTENSRSRISRRTALLTLGGIAGGIAGCSASEAGTGGDGGGETPTHTATPTDTPTPTTTTSATEVPSEVTEWLSDVGNYGGTITDRTGQSNVSVQTGAEGNNGNFAYEPAAIRVDTGTTVVWEWTGQGGSHNVVAESGGEFESKLVSDAGHTFEQTFESAGAVTYYCTPHRGVGMKGAIIVG